MDEKIKLFLCGDVMTGRGIDQILPFPSDPVLYESYVKNSQDYVNLAIKTHGLIPHPVDFSYIWGDAIVAMKKADVRIINLETSITESEHYINKGINYRMHPKNISSLKIANINCCTLANNHVMDWGRQGLLDTIETLDKAGIKYSGAGKNIYDAKAPCILPITSGNGRILVFSYGLGSSGIPNNWKAGENKPGINLLFDFSMKSIYSIRDEITKYKKHGDVIIASIHWGVNWDYEVPKTQIELAHNLIDQANVDIIHGHSSHHVKGIEIYNNKPIIYGCGDFLNDYEGISGHESYRGDLGLMYFVISNPKNGHLISLQMIPTQIRKFQLARPNKSDSEWLQLVLNREGKRFGTSVNWLDDTTLTLNWN